MNADIKGALEQIDRSYRAFIHDGRPMTKQQVKAVLEYALSKGYKHTGQLTDEEVDSILKTGQQCNNERQAKAIEILNSHGDSYAMSTGSHVLKDLIIRNPDFQAILLDAMDEYAKYREQQAKEHVAAKSWYDGFEAGVNFLPEMEMPDNPYENNE